MDGLEARAYRLCQLSAVMRTNTVVVFATSVTVSLSQHQNTTCQREVGKWVSRRVTEAATIWANGSTGQCYVPAFRRPAPAADLACTSRWQPASVLFPPNRHRTCHLESITHQRERQNPAGQAQEGIKRGVMHAPEATTGCRQSSMFQNIWNMHPLPRNLHVAFHIPNLGVTPQPPLHCLTLLHLLPHLPLGLASGQRNNQGRMNQTERWRRKLFDGRAPLRRETHPGFTTHHATPTWTCLGLLGLRNHGSTAEPACHCRLAAVPRFVCMSHTPNPDTLALDRPIP